MLAKFYLSKNIKESLKGLTESTGTFQIALGGDGCPFGKNESIIMFFFGQFPQCWKKGGIKL